MKITICKVTEFFYLIDDFSKEFYNVIDLKSIGHLPSKKPIMSHSEVITIMVLFHYGSFRNFKHFYTDYLQEHLTDCFPHTVSYNRFVELMQKESLCMTMLLKMHCLGASTGITFVDSTPIRVCNNKRIKRNRVCKDLAH